MGNTWRSWGAAYGWNPEAEGFLRGLEFEDTTYRNDGCPSFTRDADIMRVWIEAVDLDDREEYGRRFVVCFYDEDMNIRETIAAFDDWLELARYLRSTVE